MSGTHENTFFGIPATGKTFEVKAMNFYRFENRQIVEEYGLPDMFGLLRQLGAAPGI
ncbi:SnoaL-like polyketide cyclase [compost metagenome]